MADVAIEINGLLYDKLSRTTQNVVLRGKASLIGLEVGGGPVLPGDPVHIWGGGNVPLPSPPISNVPGAPGYQPPHVEHPIVLPPEKPPIDPPVDPPTNPANPQWVWGYSPRYNSWTPVYVPGPTDPTPKK